MSAPDFEALARRHGIVLLLQFGSSVTGREHAHSDLDVAVLVERAPRTLAEYGNLIGDLQALFPQREIDVGLINHADPLFLKKITEHCVLLYGERRRLAELKIYAYKRYQDYKRYLALERAYVARVAGPRDD